MIFNYEELPSKGLGKSFDGVNDGDTVILNESYLADKVQYTIWELSKRNMKNRAKEMGLEILHQHDLPEKGNRLIHRLTFIKKKDAH